MVEEEEGIADADVEGMTTSSVSSIVMADTLFGFRCEKEDGNARMREEEEGGSEEGVRMMVLVSIQGPRVEPDCLPDTAKLAPESRIALLN